MEQDRRDLNQNTLKTAREAAKQGSTIVPILITAYLALVSISNLKQTLGSSLLLGLLFVLPAFLWIFALFFALQVFMPMQISDRMSEEARSNKYVNRRVWQLRVSYYLLLVGLILMAINVLLYFAWVPLPGVSPTVVVTPTVVATPTP